MLVFPRKETNQAMIITIILAELDPETANVSVVTDLDTFVGADLPVFKAIAAVTSAMAGQHPVFLNPVLPVEALLDPEPDAAVLFDPEELAAPREAPAVDQTAMPVDPAFEKSVQALLAWRKQIPEEIADDASVMGRWSKETMTIGDLRRLAKAFERVPT